eukprot:SAG31_NODE_21528_length_547_cov_0.915179_1_plen_64_part_01
MVPATGKFSLFYFILFRYLFLRDIMMGGEKTKTKQRSTARVPYRYSYGRTRNGLEPSRLGTKLK